MLGVWCTLYEAFVLHEEGPKDGWESWKVKWVAYAGVIARGVTEAFIAQGVLALCVRVYERQRRGRL